MTLGEYVDREGKGTLTRLHRDTSLAYTTILRVAQGKKWIESFDLAESLSAATNGEVPISNIWGPAARGEVERLAASDTQDS